MQNRTSILSFIFVAAGTAALLATTANSQLGQPKNYVNLQPTSPGTSQSGHLNVNGTARAAQFVGGGGNLTSVDAVKLGGLAASQYGLINGNNLWSGINSFSNPSNTFNGNGAGLANVNADLLDGINSTSFLQAVPNPLTLNGSSTSSTITVTNTGGRAIFARSSASNGDPAIYAEGLNSMGVGVWGNTTGGVAIHGTNNGSNGIAVDGFMNSSIGQNYGVSGVVRSLSDNSVGVFGSATGSSGVTFGGRFESQSGNGIGVFGWGAATSGFNYGLYGRADSEFGIGVYGVASENSGQNCGVKGVGLSPNGYGVYSIGNSGASGTKSFRIDHPLDPENRYLLHYSAEGPEPRNVYQGHVKTGMDGFAWVNLPDYYCEINRDPEYTLTVLDSSDDFVLAKVSQKVVGNHFQIRTSKPRVEVSWRIEGIRNDRWVRQNGAPVEVDKPAHERGKYQVPELYGMPAERGTNFGHTGEGMPKK